MTEPAQRDASTAFRTLIINLAAFGYAAGIFVSTKKFLDFAPTEAVAVGRVTVDGISKLQDYVRFGFFLLLVPLLTILLIHWLPRIGRRLVRSVSEVRLPLTVVALAATPLVLSPLLYLATYKELWSVLLPPVLSWMIVKGWVIYARSERLQHLVRSGDRGTHALIVSEGLAILLFRYVATGSRIAHMPSLLLETIFIVVFLSLWWGALAALALLFSRRRDEQPERAFEQIGAGAFPLVLLPIAGLIPIDPLAALTVAILLSAAGVALFLFAGIDPPAPRVVDRFVAWFACPVILFVLGYASAAHTSGWIDLFHQGETLGPASDYLRGKLPYEGVFPLHGLLQNGLLDAWLMEWFGKSVEVATIRAVVFEALMIPAIWLLSWVSFRSWIASAGAVAGAFILAADNQRAVLEIVVVLLLVASLRGGKRAPVVFAGVLSSVALFFSFETGLYSLIAAPVAFAAIWLLEPSRGRALEPVRQMALFAAGAILGAAPFLLWLASHDLAGSFFTTSFVTIPGLIDATWSLPFPDLDDWFSKSLPAASLFQLAWHIRFVINPLILAVAIIVLAYRATRRTVTLDDSILAVLVVFATISQRSALGRADFFHQWFAAFLISPVLIALLWRAVNAARRQAPSVRAAIVMATIAILPVALTLFWVPSLLDSRLKNTIDYRARQAGTAPDPDGEMSTRRIERVVAAIHERTSPEEPIFDFSNQPALYFLADRRNPTRFYQVPITSPVNLQREVIASLERERPALVVMSSPDSFHRFDGVLNRDRAPLVASWIDHHYSPDVMVEGIDLWVPSARDTQWTAPDQVPGPDDVALRPQSEGRLVFPSVGSVTGGDGAKWSTDLFIHNPHPVPVTYRLRYVTSSSVHERPVAVPPRQGRRINDVAASHFGSTQQLGALWIVYDQTYPPVARTVTLRDPGSGRGTHSQPLGPPDAADAETPRATLLITGFESSPEERVNLSLVNFGTGPATATVRLIDREGATLGRVYHAAIAEENAFLVVDVVTAVGARPAPEGAIRIDVSEGVVASQLSIVDPGTGSSDVVTAVPVKE